MVEIKQETGYEGCELGLLDLGDLSSVVQYAEKYKNEPLDILIANAGIAMFKYETTKDGWESKSVLVLNCE